MEPAAELSLHDDAETLRNDRDDPLLPLHATARDLTQANGDWSDLEKPKKQDARPTAYLDGLRGLAALVVYISHHVVRCYGSDDAIRRGYDFGSIADYATPSNLTATGSDGADNGHDRDERSPITALPFIRFFFSGGGAVAIFFVLSGYVLSRNTLAKLRAGDMRKLYTSLGRSVLKRPFRLYGPPMAVSLAVAMVMQLPKPIRPYMAWPESQPTLIKEMVNWAYETVLALNPFCYHDMMTRWFPYDPPIWTMPVELQGSMLVFALVAGLSLLQRRHWKIALVVVAIGLRLFWDWAMPCFVVGQLLALDHLESLSDWSASKRRFLSDRAKNAILHFIALLGWYFLGFSHDGIEALQEAHNSTVPWFRKPADVVTNGDSYRFWNSIGAVLLIYAILHLGWLQRLLMRPLLQFLGHVSFMLYLTHLPLLSTVGDRVYRLFGAVLDDSDPMWWDNRLVVPDVGPLGLSTRFVAAQAIIAPLSIAVAFFATRWIDEPSVRLAHRIAAAKMT
jgi:peptidoglycan/LPS O-acetylase OafA/YrhL